MVRFLRGVFFKESFLQYLILWLSRHTSKIFFFFLLCPLQKIIYLAEFIANGTDMIRIQQCLNRWVRYVFFIHKKNRRRIRSTSDLKTNNAIWEKQKNKFHLKDFKFESLTTANCRFVVLDHFKTKLWRCSVLGDYLRLVGATFLDHLLRLE